MTGTVFLDFQRPFDSMDHDILLYKYKGGISHTII